jgi:hypothetical protein
MRNAAMLFQRPHDPCPRTLGYKLPVPKVGVDRKTLKIPERTKSMHTLLGTPLHHLIVALTVARNEDDLSTKSLPCVSQQLHRVRAATPLLAVPEDHALGLNVLMDETCDCGAKCAFLIRADPD